MLICPPLTYSFMLFTSLFVGDAVFDTSSQLEFPAVVVRAEKTLTLASQQTGQVKTTRVELGDNVAAGELLLELDPRQQVLEVSKLEHELGRSRAAVEKAKAVVSRAKKAVSYRKKDLERHRKLGESVGNGELRKLQEAAEVAEVQHVIAYQEFLQAEQQVKISQTEVDSAKLRLKQLSTTAPLGGVVSKVHAVSTNRVVAGDPIVDLYVLDNVLCKVFVPEADVDLQQLLSCQVFASFSVAGSEYKLQGQVISCDPEVDARGLIGVTIRLPNRFEQGRWLLLHGKTVDVSLQMERSYGESDEKLAE